MRRILSVFVILIMLLQVMACGSKDIVPKREILAIYNNPNSQILTEDGNSTNKANSMTYMYEDETFTQYVLHDGRCDKYAEGTFEVDFDWDTVEWGDGLSHVLVYHIEATSVDGKTMQKTNITNEVNLDLLQDYCLYPDNVKGDEKLVAVYMQDRIQKFEHKDGSEEYLPTTWIYYDDGTFQQYVLIDSEDDTLFSEGDYHFESGDFEQKNSKIVIHRTKKYKDGVGLSDYDSTHEYELDTLGFVKVYPET